MRISYYIDINGVLHKWEEGHFYFYIGGWGEDVPYRDHHDLASITKEEAFAKILEMEII